MNTAKERGLGDSLGSVVSLGDDIIMKLVYEGSARGRPSNPPVSETAILGIVSFLTQEKFMQGVSISEIAAHLPTYSYYDIHKSVQLLIKERRLRRRNVLKVGESAMIVLVKRRAPKKRRRR